jgi:hypothetical protein
VCARIASFANQLLRPVGVLEAASSSSSSSPAAPALLNPVVNAAAICRDKEHIKIGSTCFAVKIHQMVNV